MTPDDRPPSSTADAVSDSNDPTDIGSAADGPEEIDTSVPVPDGHDDEESTAYGPPDAPAHDLDPTKPSTAGELGAATSDDPDEIVGTDELGQPQNGSRA